MGWAREATHLQSARGQQGEVEDVPLCTGSHSGVCVVPVFLASADPDDISMPTASCAGSVGNAAVWHYANHVPSAAVMFSDILCVTCHADLNVLLGLGCYYKSSLFTSTFHAKKLKGVKLQCF